MRPFRLLTGTITREACKAALQLSESDDEAEQAARMGLEESFAAALLRALRRQLRLLIPVEATDEMIRTAPQRVEETSSGVKDTLRKWLIAGSVLGLAVGDEQLATVGIGFDWGLANQHAADWASRHSGELIRGINRTTQGRVQTAVSDFFENADTLPDLRRELTPIFGERRAQTIAQTETTQAAAEGAEIGFRASGVVEKWTWATAADERVCPICAPLEGVTVNVGDEFAPGIKKPYAHVNCRCWVRPWVDN